MSRRLRLASPTTKAVNITFDQGLREVMRIMAADNPSVAFFAWRSPDGKLRVLTLPHDDVVVRGFVEKLHEKYNVLLDEVDDGDEGDGEDKGG